MAKKKSPEAVRFQAHDAKRLSEGEKRVTVSLYAPHDEASPEVEALRARMRRAMRRAGQRVLSSHVANS